MKLLITGLLVLFFSTGTFGEIGAIKGEILNHNRSDQEQGDGKEVGQKYNKDNITITHKTLALSPDNINEVKIMGSHLNDIKIVASTSENIEIKFTVLRDKESSVQAQNLMQSLGHRIVGDKLLVYTMSKRYKCFSFEKNIMGVTSLYVKGACYGQVVVALPPSQKISVFSNRTPLNNFSAEQLGNIPDEHMQIDTFIEEINGAFSSELEGIIKKFISSREKGFKLSSSEMEEILQKISFSLEKLSAFKALVPLIPRAERAGLASIIDDAFMGSDAKHAIEFLITLP